jgi:hypothetical protein
MESFQPGLRIMTEISSRDKVQPGLKLPRLKIEKTQRFSGFISVCFIFKCKHSLAEDMNNILDSSKKRNASILRLYRFSPG